MFPSCSIIFPSYRWTPPKDWSKSPLSSIAWSYLQETSSGGERNKAHFGVLDTASGLRRPQRNPAPEQGIGLHRWVSILQRVYFWIYIYIYIYIFDKYKCYIDLFLFVYLFQIKTSTSATMCWLQALGCSTQMMVLLGNFASLNCQNTLGLDLWCAGGNKTRNLTRTDSFAMECNSSVYVSSFRPKALICGTILLPLAKLGFHWRSMAIKQSSFM